MTTAHYASDPQGKDGMGLALNAVESPRGNRGCQNRFNGQAGGSWLAVPILGLLARVPAGVRRAGLQIKSDLGE